MSRPGFTLISCVIYLALSTIIVVPLLSLLAHLYSNSIKTMRIMNQREEGAIFYELFTRDIRQAPALPDFWVEQEDTKIRWRVNDQIYGWIAHDGTIFRTVSRYDQKKNRWVTDRSLITKTADAHFIMQKDAKRITAVGCRYRLPASDQLYTILLTPRGLHGT